MRDATRRLSVICRILSTNNIGLNNCSSTLRYSSLPIKEGKLGSAKEQTFNGQSSLSAYQTVTLFYTVHE